MCCTELSLIDARGVCTAYLGSSRDLPQTKEKNLGFVLATFDPGHAIWLKTCDPQCGLFKRSIQDLLCLDMNLSSSLESLASKGDIRDNWGPKAGCARVLPMANTNYTSPLPVKERVFPANVVGQGTSLLLRSSRSWLSSPA